VSVQIPPRSLITVELVAWAKRLEAAARYAGALTLTSWYRDPARNAAVGGAAASRHLRGLAVDVVARDPSRATAAFRAFGFRVLNEGDHLHVD
jgi:uncharacterized protein YcbK (DUF882 family)